MSAAARHSLIEDGQGIAFGICLAAVGLHVMTHMGFVSGQTTGMAALIAYSTGAPFPVVYFLISLPFLAFGGARMGWRFAAKTVISVTAMTLLTAALPGWLHLGTIEPAFAAVLFGALFGFAALAVVRHGGSFGGVSILWLMLQDRTGFRAGYAQLLFDLGLFGLSAFIVPAETLGWSFLGAVVFNLFLAINHRKDRYIAT